MVQKKKRKKSKTINNNFAKEITAAEQFLSIEFGAIYRLYETNK